MPEHKVATRRDWLEARRALLASEKQFTRAREALASERRELPWLKVDKAYRFHTARGDETLGELFDGRSQLLVYHFMFGPDWQQGCPSCSFWADNYNGALPHLRARDINLVAVSRGPLARLLAYRDRLGWKFDWVSSADSDFNFDFAVSFEERDDEQDPTQKQANYNFDTVFHGGDEAPGLSVFLREGDDIYHTYSCYARGLDNINGAYQMIDLTPRGRDEAELPWPMAWVRRNDEYGDEGAAESL